MQTWHLHISGQVQGVGFRPFVYRLAVTQKLCGWVNNTSDGVHIVFNAKEEQASTFCQLVIDEAPNIASITGYHLSTIPPQNFSEFNIVHSQSNGPAKLLLTPDFGLCQKCRDDIHSSSNRRHQYAFTTCTYCGPRYSIIKGLPYDRPLTSMKEFDSCPSCIQEYKTPTDRRYYSQTNSCEQCGILLRLYDNNGRTLEGSQATMLQQVVGAWEMGKIVAIKGIGGYLLTCDASNESAIKRLRGKKHRPTKPLAVMFPNEQCITQHTKLHATAQHALQGQVVPVVILPVQPDSPLALDTLVPGLQQLGVLLPYTPLYELLLHRFGHPVVATSGNTSGQPIIYSDDHTSSGLLQLTDYVLANNREIEVPQDDSVVQWSQHYHQRIVLRRARGLAPTLAIQHNWYTDKVVAMGADIKSAFALLHQKQCYLSAYLGDLTDVGTQNNLRHSFLHLQSTLQATPECVLVDTHPQYASTQLGQDWATINDLPTIRVPHHEAHFAAILGEHNLTTSKQAILGVVWDGTGLGGDGQIWGGEFFDYRQGQIEHLAQLHYYPSPLGDKLAREPRLCAWSLLQSAGLDPMIIAEQFTQQELSIYQQLFNRPNPLQTSSMGRLFDGVSALLGIKNKQSYEAEAAMLLENSARQYAEAHGLDDVKGLIDWSLIDQLHLPTNLLIQQLVKTKEEYNMSISELALRFHQTLVDWVATIAQRQAYECIAFTGGVFQNSLLIDLCIHQLSDQYTLYFHEQLSPNDENIAFGQLVWYDIQQIIKAKTSDQYVFSYTR